MMRWHYQSVVLPHLKNSTSILPRHAGTEFLPLEERPVRPIEFAAAAYRFGHSMVRPIYRLNTEVGNDAMQDQKDRAVDGRQFIFAALQKEGLNGFHEFPVQWAMDWRLFFVFDRKLDGPGNRGPNRFQPAYKIDCSLVYPLAFLPEFSQEVQGRGVAMDNDGHPLAKKDEIANLDEDLKGGEDRRLRTQGQ